MSTIRKKESPIGTMNSHQNWKWLLTDLRLSNKFDHWEYARMSHSNHRHQVPTTTRLFWKQWKSQLKAQVTYNPRRQFKASWLLFACQHKVGSRTCLFVCDFGKLTFLSSIEHNPSKIRVLFVLSSMRPSSYFPPVPSLLPSTLELSAAFL